MPADFNSPEEGRAPQNDGSMFAPTPLWDRQARKRQGRGAADSRDPAIEAGEGVIGTGAAVEPVDAVYETQPAEPRTARRSGVAVGVLAAGVVAIVAVGAFAWYASRPHDTGIAELTPGSTATSRTALNTAAAPSANPMTPAVPAAAPAPAAASREATPRASTPAASRRTHATLAARAPTSRVRPAESNSALDAGVNAAASAPVISTPAPSPAPAPTTAPSMSPAPITPVIPPSPTTTAPSEASPPPVNRAPTSAPTPTP